MVTACTTTFNRGTLHSAQTAFLLVSHDSQNRQSLFPYIVLTGWIFKWRQPVNFFFILCQLEGCPPFSFLQSNVIFIDLTYLDVAKVHLHSEVGTGSLSIM